MVSDNRAELVLVAEDTAPKGTKSSRSLFDPPINGRAISKIAGDDGTKIA